ncbi:XRE family transcriptional regulator [Streptomyces ipomoeae]|uniref:XRE family transcriptional regulator n=1 Tax=Streptomyces ipomoeae TaxID=103232 RepID=A0AAE8VZI1_9ACTN|nr:helix-turn-helix transcriptional regulator [Streptomyces ipomoeae]TQE29367.1 XRE family transcriptional regulator [Streptomyces ipomoeae]TQE31979.1 XRE family transcriptional regulator [Streptomyces ipomoeae]
MTPVGNAPAEHGWIEKELSSDVSPGRRALAMALRDLCRYLRPERSAKPGNKELTQTEAAKRLHSNPSSLSRFLGGKRVPGPEFIETLYKEACSAAGDDRALSITLDELKALRLRAVAERRCSKCADLSKRTAELASLKREAATLRAAVTELSAAKAGLQARLAAQASLAPPPVPRRRGDRRRSQKNVSAARQVAARAEELDRGGRQDAALTLLRQTTEVLSPAETAVVLLALRQQQQNRLADNLIHIYGRDQGDRNVIQVALELHEQGAEGDAGAVLRAAVR